MTVVPTQALHFLRHLEVVFPPFHDDYLRPSEPAYRDWLQTIEYVRELLYLPTLTLRVYMADDIFCGEPVADFRRTITKEQGITILKMYARTLAPLSKLREKGLSQFFAHLAWPFAHTRRSRRNPTFEMEQTAYMRQRMERLVMGDDYDRTLLQTREPGNSQWLEACLADCMAS